MIFGSERRLLDACSLPMMILDQDLKFLYGNPAYLKATHRELDDLTGHYIFDVFPDEPERVEPVREQFLKTIGGELTQLDAQPFQLEYEDGTVHQRVWQTTQDPIYDENGKVVGLLQRAEDITQQFELEQRNLAMSHELNHRVKNIMAVVMSIARITGRISTSVPSFVKSFTARLNAMSRTHDQLALNEWRGLAVQDIIEDELKPYTQNTDTAFSLKGPDVRLSVEATKDLSMLLHELTTNAAKYGCLSSDMGHLSIRWGVKDETLKLYWQELCDKEITPPKEAGFGTKLSDMLPYVEVERDYTPKGLHLVLTMEGETVFG